MRINTDISNIQLNDCITLKPEYLNHDIISGNKLRKLKYNLIQAKDKGHEKILTFGGAYSNHIAAVAYAGKMIGLQTIGIIRGSELEQKKNLNPTLAYAISNGMILDYVKRSVYRQKINADFLKELKQKYGRFYLLPEGGTNALAVKGCEEILGLEDKDFDIICCPVGTGGTIAGIINSSFSNQKILGFPSLRGNFLNKDIAKFAKRDNWQLVHDYHFGGYAKINRELISFINQFKLDYGIQLDPVYTGKMMYGIFDMVKKKKFPERTRILAIHTGGLQGIAGMNAHLKQSNMPLLS